MTADGGVRGEVVGLFRKGGAAGERGLPKPNVQGIEVDARGVVGDFNRYRHENLRDDPDRALLLLPMETVAQLRREGWPVSAGDLGENVSSRGSAYDRLGWGVTLELGSIRVMITRPCEPCTNLYGLPYVGEPRGPEFLKTLVGRRGWYARVQAPGKVRLGDPIELR